MLLARDDLEKLPRRKIHELGVLRGTNVFNEMSSPEKLRFWKYSSKVSIPQVLEFPVELNM